MYTKMVSKVGYYSAALLQDMSKYNSLTSPLVWREVAYTSMSQEDKNYLFFIFTDPEVLRIRLRNITSWAELKQFATRLKRLGRMLNHEATGENWRRYNVLEDWSFLLTEFGDCVDSLTELKNTKMPIQDVLKEYVSRI